MTAAEPVIPATPPKPLRALMIEDSEDDALLIQRELRRGGYDVTAHRVDSAAAMQDAIAWGRWDVILSDHSMPSFDALAALDICRRAHVTAPFIVVSGAIGEEAAVRAMKAGAQDYVMKGNLSRLTPAIERELRDADDRRERHRIEELLHEREEWHRQIIETAQEGIWAIDSSGMTTFVNAKMADMLGVGVEDMLGASMFDFMDEEGQQEAVAYLERRRQGISEHHGFRFRRRDGSTVWTLVASNPLTDKQGRYAGSLAMITDMTEYRRGEEALRDSEERFRKVFEESPIGMGMSGPDGRFLRVNGSMCAMLGFAEAELIGMRTRDLTFPPDLHAETVYADQLLAGEVPFYKLEKRYVTRSGDIVWSATTTSIIRDAAGRPIWQLTMAEDITERRRVEAAFREAMERYHTIFDQAADSIAIFDTQTEEIAEFNDPAHETLGYTREEFARLRITDFDAGTEAGGLIPHIEKAAREGRDVYETRFRRQNGELRDVLVSARRITIRGKDLIHAIWSDITDRKRMEEDLRRAIERLQDHDRVRSEFVSNVSHELRTPLASFIYATRNLLKGVAGPLPENAYRYLKMLEGESQRMLHTVNAILDMRQVEAIAQQMARIRLPLARIVARGAESLRVQADEKLVTLDLAIDKKAGFVECDPARLERVIYNIIGNAIKFTPAGGSVTVAVARDASGAPAMTVTDTGVGIPQEALPKIGERYFRAGSHSQGSGLGLAISKEIITIHGGDITVTSPVPGRSQGTQVVVRLPACEPPLILLAGSLGDSREPVERQLAGYGYRLVSCEHPDDSPPMTGAQRPNCILINADSGFDVAIRLKCRDDLREVPAVAVAANDPSDAHMRVFQDLAIRVVAHPRHRDRVIDSVEETIIGRNVFQLSKPPPREKQEEKP